MVQQLRKPRTLVLVIAQVSIICNQDNIICTIGQSKAHHRKYKQLKPGGGQAYD
jgi:hypothetical protein